MSIGRNKMTQTPTNPELDERLEKIVLSVIQDWNESAMLGRDEPDAIASIGRRAKADIAALLEKEALKARQNEIATTCIAGVGGLTPEQQVFFEKRLADLEKQLGSK
jgi:hypothetical protein